MLTGCDQPADAARVFRDAGAGCVVIKLGARGCAVFDCGDERRVAAFPVDVVDTTGAGDCFAGAFLAGLVLGLSLEESARLANAAGALSVGALGSTDGLRSYEETRAWMARAGVSGS